ncbi:MAG: acetyl-coenzyme A synthetase N-terminal domain-containing protein, partial [Planctomycetota bacterium]
MTDSSAAPVDHVLQETRLFPPSKSFTDAAVISSQQQYEEMYAAARDDRDGFWDEQAKEHLHWFEPYNEVCRWEAPHVEWFVGGKTNASYNCLDRNVDQGRGDKTAIIWEGEPGETRTLNYRQLLTEVCRCAAA